MVFDATVQQRALRDFIDSKLVVDELLVKEFEGLVELAVHALAFDQDAESDGFGEDFVLHHTVVGLDRPLHVLEVDAHVDETVKEYVVNLYVFEHQFVNKTETFVESVVFVELVHMLLDAFHQSGVGETVGLDATCTHVRDQPVGLVHVVDAHEKVDQSILGDGVHGQVWTLLNFFHQDLAQFPILLQRAALDQGVLGDQVWLDFFVHFHLLELFHGRLKILGGHTRIDHAVVQYLVGQLRVLDVFKHFGDEREFLALVPVDDPLDQAGVREVVGLDLLIEHLSVTLPCTPEVFAPHLPVYDGIVAYGSRTDVGFAHQF